MDKVKKLLDQYLTIDCKQLVVSGRRKSGEVQKIKVRPVLLKEALWFQVTSYVGKQVLHKNVAKEEAEDIVMDALSSAFKQMQLVHCEKTFTVLVNKKQKAVIREAAVKTAVPVDLQHNRTKQYLIEEGSPVPFLVELGVMTKDGAVVRKKYDKFRQINRFLEYVRDVEKELPNDRPCTIIDFGCGKSYLTFAMYYYLHEKRGMDVRMIGLDLKEEVISHCNSLAEKFGYENLTFLTGDIKDYEGAKQVDMVVTLHACDTATDYALYKAVNWKAKVILSVPCCQHELNAQIHSDALAPMLSYGILKERMAALATDAMRAELLKQMGYDTQILEFIDMEHTPKNLLLRAVLGTTVKELVPTPEYQRFCNALGGTITLERLLKAGDNECEE